MIASRHATRVIAANGVQLTVAPGWRRIPATPTSISEPRTLLVAGTSGVRPNLQSQCQVAAYHLPPSGAAVVVISWKKPVPTGTPPTGLAPLKELRKVRRPSFECFSGRGAAVQVVLARRAYQINVLVGDQASSRRIAEALRIGRSFARVR